MGENHCYCPKCGLITPGHRATENGKPVPCFNCGHNIEFEINPKWNINDDSWEELYNRVRYGEITEEEFDKQWNEHCLPFIEEVVFKRPEFSRKDYEHIPIYEEERKRYLEEYDSRIEEARKYMKSSSSFSATCPYCKSSNTKKISAAGRMFSAGLFGFGSKKIGKQWHCNGCGSDF